MAIDTLLQEAQTMSEDTLNQVLRFMRFLKKEELSSTAAKGNASLKQGYFREPGGLSGKVILSPDFDEPLDDFKEYM